MKRWNLLAASLIAATFVLLALVPLTRNALRFDVRMAASGQGLSGLLVDLGFRQDGLPFNGFGPPLRSGQINAIAPSPEFTVRLANVMHLGGREKWTALQQLVVDFPENPAAHAALVRMACKNGGSVGVGHSVDQAAVSPPSQQVVTVNKGEGDPNDAAIMLRSCAAGERLDPWNAYFPAMAAVAYLALDQTDSARAALQRAAEKPLWREYIEAEVDGSIRRAEILYGPQNSLTKAATMASILFPHYAALRSMGRVFTARAMYAEQKGDIDAGLTLRKDIARVGEKMRQQGSTIIAGLVGVHMIYGAEQRPGGAPFLEDTSKNDQQFLKYLTAHSTTADVAHWQQYIQAAEASQAITRQAGNVSSFGFDTLFPTQFRLLANMALLGVTIFLCLLGGLALARPWLGGQWGRVGSIVVVTLFIAVVLWGGWQVLGNVRNILAFSNLLQGLAGNGSEDPAVVRAREEALRLAVFTEIGITLLTLLLPVVYLTIVSVLAKYRGISMGWYLRRWTLPLAASLLLGYAAHLATFSLREQAMQAGLQEVATHEGRHIAGKLGKTWPVVPE